LVRLHAARIYRVSGGFQGLGRKEEGAQRKALGGPRISRQRVFFVRGGKWTHKGGNQIPSFLGERKWHAGSECV